MNINTSQAAAAHAANTQAILQAPVWNPSMGPSPSIMPSGQKIPTNPATNMSNMSQAQPITANQVCKTFPRDAKYFKLGEIISIPFHEPNSNPNLQPQDHRLRLTWKGSVFTKRRMMVVLWIYKRDMFCLPLYSFNGAGLNSKSRFIQPEYVCLKNCDATKFVKQGVYDPIEATYMHKPFDENTAIHITGGTKVSCIDDIAFCGRVNPNSYKELVKLWENLANAAKRQAY